MRGQSLRIPGVRRTDWSIKRISNRIVLLFVQVLEDSLAELELLGVRLASVLPALGGLQDGSSISRGRNLTLGAVDRVRLLALWSTTCGRRASDGPGFLHELRRLDLMITFVSSIGASPRSTHLLRAGHVLQSLVEGFLHILAHLGDEMVGPIECQAVPKHEPDIGNELIDGVVWRIVCLLHLGTAAELLLDGTQVHRVGDDIWIMGYTQSDVINGTEERYGVLHLFEATDGGEGVFLLGRGYWP
jgi:hypothetical protein